ncbi:MAG: hypothetical protein IKE15_08460 [Clostridia bacterium]|nr:hypothetical protein [Clostridia bacterium]
MKSFFLPVGRSAGTSLPTVVSAMSCGAALPVTGLDILHIADQEPDPVLPALIRDLNSADSLFSRSGNLSLFPSSFSYESFRPQLPSVRSLSEDASSAALLGALRGKGIPLSYKTDREAVEWAFSSYLSLPENGAAAPLMNWVQKIRDCQAKDEAFRIAVCCDLCDPFSSGIAFAMLRYLAESVKPDPSDVALFCLGIGSDSSGSFNAEMLSSSLHAMAGQNLTAGPDQPGSSCADAVWLLGLPSSLISSGDSLRVLYVVLARLLARFCVSEKKPASGLHTVSLPGVLTLHSLGDEAAPFAAFLHAASWLLSDLIPAFRDYIDHPAALRGLAPNTRNGLFRKLLHGTAPAPDQADLVTVLDRVLRAVLSEALSLIRFLPDPLRLAEVSDPLWKQIVDACGKTVTVASEYSVSLAEAEEGGFLDVKPVHRVSMADTVEEIAGRRLKDIALQLKDEEEARNRLFSSSGFWAGLALRDCRTRCQDALSRAREQQKSRGADEDRLSSAALSRRIRLLEAAVSRCDADLSNADLLTAVSAGASGLTDGMNPFSGQILNAEAAEKLSLLLTSSDDSSDSVRKEIMALMPSLLFGFSLSDTKALFRKLLSSCSAESKDAPFVNLILAALDVSRDEVGSLRFLSSGDVPPIPVLPDLRPFSGSLLTVASLLPLLPETQSAVADSASEKRGLLAMILLRQYRMRFSDESSLSLDRYSSGDSPVLHAWLASRNSDCVWILSLGSGDERLPFALILPGRDLIPARITVSHVSFLPTFAAPWFDPETLSFSDPCGLLGEGDRTVLTERLGALEGSRKNCSDEFIAFLKAFRLDLEASSGAVAVPGRLDLRLRSAFGLRLLPAFQPVLVRKACPYERSLVSDDIAARLVGRPSFPPFDGLVPDDIIYLYRDVPFARENSKTLLESIPLPAENWILNLLDQECRTLSRASDDYHDALTRELSLLLDRYPDALPEARQVALDLLEKAGAPVPDTEAVLAWPWDIRSPSVFTILAEALGNTLATAAVQPFSDLLALFPARGSEVIGDSLMSSMCLLPPVSSPADQEDRQPELISDAVLPPLSSAFCAALCRLPEGRTLIRPGLLSFERTDADAVRVTLTLEGSFTVRMTREYNAEQIVHLYAHDIPTLAVWPNLPFAPEDWHAYFVYASLPDSVRINIFGAGGEVLSPDGEGARAVCRSESFPLSFSFMWDGRSMGSLPNLLPTPEIEKTEPCTACIDFGSVGTSVVFSVGHKRRPMQGPTLVRTLLNNPARSRDLLRREFLPAVPVSALLPTASRLFRNVAGAAPLPFEDGIVLMSSDMQDVLSIPSGALYTCLKWEEDKGRSVTLCLHQIMLMTALQARSDGASSLLWRFSIPDEMAKEGRERLVSLFTALAGEVCGESGFALPDKQPLVTFAAESSALGAYFRLCASEDTRGGFMVLDIGASTADISLFLRGREQAVRTCQIPLGVHYMLLPALLRDPGLLQQDLGFIQDPSFIQDLELLSRILRNAKADPSALRHSRLALDSFIADRYTWLLPALLQNPATGMPGRIGSELLLHFSFLMMLSGLILLQIAADPGKNDFLPEQMSLCLSGRGSLLPEGLPDQYKTALWHFLTMFRNRRVASLSMLFSSEKKMEIPVGLSVLQEVSADLPPASAVPAAISVRPEELLPQFILRFAKEFPASAEILFHGFFTGDFYHPFTPYGESVISEAISQSFTEQTALRPYDALSAWIGALLEQIDTSEPLY